MAILVLPQAVDRFPWCQLKSVFGQVRGFGDAWSRAWKHDGSKGTDAGRFSQDLLPGSVQEPDRACSSVNTRPEVPRRKRHRASIGQDPERRLRSACDQDRDTLGWKNAVRAVADTNGVRGQDLEPERITAQ